MILGGVFPLIDLKPARPVLGDLAPPSEHAKLVCAAAQAARLSLRFEAELRQIF
jgi:hypothetical protein